MRAGESLADIAVGRQAVVAAVDLRHRKGDPFAGGRIELAAVERCGKCQLAIQDLGAVRDEAEHVGHGTELLFDPFEQGFGRFGGVVDFRGRNAGHR